MPELNLPRLEPFYGKPFEGSNTQNRDFQGTGAAPGDVSVVGNTLDQTSWELVLPGFTERSSFACQSVVIPNISIGEVLHSTRINPNNSFLPGDTITYSPLIATFVVNRDLRTYELFYNWALALATPEDPSQFTKFVTQETVNRMRFLPEYARLMHDVIILLKGSETEVLGRWYFVDCFPSSVDGFQLDASLTETPAVSFQVVFRYSRFEFTRSPHA